MATQPSLLDDLGEEVTGIMAPVSLCMAVTVLLVRLLNPEGASSSNSVLIASIAYQENASDSSGKKLGGALLNAIIFVAVIAGMTVVLFLLFKYRCYKFIYAYMGFAVFNIFFFLTGALFIQVMQVINLHIDAFSLAYGLFNFSVVGTMGLLFVPIPLLLKQIYLIWVGIIVAYIFTFIPEWTAWVILVFMALYDIAAVLIPGGPLKALVELAIERRQDLPALIYEARPAGGRPYVRGWGNRAPAADGGEAGGSAGAAAPRPVAEAAAPQAGNTVAPSSLEMRRPASRGSRPPSGGSAGGGGGDVRRGGSGGSGAMSGGWVSGPSRNSLAAAEAAALPRGGGGGGGAAARQDSQAEGAGGPPGASVRSFGSQQAGDSLHQQQQSPSQQQQLMLQPRRFGSGPAGGGGGGSLGPRPVAEGRELEGAGPWKLLPSGAAPLQQQQQQGPQQSVSPRSGGGVSPRGDSLRERLSKVLSASAGRDAGGGGADGSSHTSQEPLIQPPGANSSSSGGSERPLQPGASGAVGPSNSASPSQQKRQAGGGGGGSRDDATMGVRAVAPALSEEQLAEAVRRSIRNAGDAPPPTQQQQPGPTAGAVVVAAPGAPADGEQRRGPTDGEEEPFDPDLPDAIKLGLGDFIFYSMLVGRAAMYDYMTVFSSYLAIIAGLGLTLLCLAIYQKALPALPFSIALGVAFYFLTRLTLEPFLVPLSVHLAYY